MYADDIKLYNNSSNAVLLKEDLLAVYKWSTDWLLPLNIDKCEVLYIGKKNPKVSYYIDGTEFTKSDCCRNLGILVSSDLLWSNQVDHVTKRAMLFLLSKVFCKIIPMVFLKLYKTYIRLMLKFSNSAWTDFCAPTGYLTPRVGAA